MNAETNRQFAILSPLVLRRQSAQLPKLARGRNQAFLSLVYRGVRHARSEGGEELARRVVVVSVPATKEISDWLKTLGMFEYADGSVESMIDVSVLRHLTDQDLRDFGVLRSLAR
jgi:hypothetical protein